MTIPLVLDHRLRGERWDLYGEMRVLNRNSLPPGASYGDDESEESSTPVASTGRRRRTEATGRTGSRPCDERVSGNEEHYRTDFTFVLVADEIPDEVRSFVEGQRERTLLKYGYYGHYEVNLGVVAPDEQDAVAGEAADVVEAFVLWEDVTQPDEGVLSGSPSGSGNDAPDPAWLRRRLCGDAGRLWRPPDEREPIEASAAAPAVLPESSGYSPLPR